MKNFLTKRMPKLRLLPYWGLKHGQRYKEKKIKLQGKPFVVADSVSFYHSYKEIFIEQIYKFNTEKKSPFIIDCGSNYGVSIIYFKMLFPNANILGIEADPNIYKILAANMEQRNFGNVEVINKAVSSSKESIHFISEGADSGRIVVDQNEVNTLKVDTVNLDDLIDQDVDFLKMDIEGAETDVICSSNKLKFVSQIFIEYHSYKNKPQTLYKLLNKLTSEEFRYYIHTQFCSPQPLTKELLYLDMDLQLNIFATKES